MSGLFAPSNQWTCRPRPSTSNGLSVCIVLLLVIILGLQRRATRDPSLSTWRSTRPIGCARSSVPISDVPVASAKLDLADINASQVAEAALVAALTSQL